MIQYSDKVITKLTRLLWGEKIERVACLIGDKDGDDFRVMDVLSARNEDYKPSEEFFISGKQMNGIVSEAKRRGYTVLGIAHSHLAHHPAIPSQADIRYCRHEINVVYHPSSNRITWFNSEGEIQHEEVESPRPKVFFPRLIRAFA